MSGAYNATSGYNTSLNGVNPTNNSGYLDRGDTKGKEMKQMMDWRYTSSYPQNAAAWQQAYIDRRFKVGDQSLNNLIYGAQQFNSNRFFFNLIMRHQNMITGYQRKNRKSTIVMPIQHDSDPLADDWNKTLKWSEDRDGFQEYLSQSFDGATTTGLNLLHLYPDYTLDPISGDLFTDQVDNVNVLIDCYFKKQDLTDCSFVWRRRWVNKNSAKALLPGMAKEIDKMNPSGMKDGRFPLQAELVNLDTNRLFTYDEFHYRDSREATIILDPKTGESAEWEDEEGENPDFLNMIMKQQPWLITRKVQVPTVKLCISLGGVPVYHGKNLLNIDAYPFVPSLFYHEPDIQSYVWRFRGLPRNLRDAQYLYNRRKTIELQILESQINSGFFYQVDGLVDPKALRQTGEGFLVPVKSGRVINEVIQRIPPPDIPQSMLELSRSLAEDITKISGVNEELLGAATDDKSGILSMLRQGAGLVTLQTVFDKLDYTQRLYGNIRMQAIRKNFSKGKIRSILGHDPDPRFFSTYSCKYGLAVEEGNYSTTQRQMELQQLLHFKEIGIPISNKDIVGAAFITNKKQVIENMEQEQQAQSQQAQQEAQMSAQESQAKNMLTMAKTKESLAKVDEIESTAEHKKTESELNLLRVMIELEHLDMDGVAKTWQLAQSLKQANEVEAKKSQTLNQGAQNG